MLPQGFEDLVGDAALKQHKLGNQILDFLFAKNYQLVKPAMFEYMDQSDSKELKQRNCFWFKDFISDSLLLIRDDVTKSLARIVANMDHKNELSLCYLEDVYIKKPDSLLKKRKYTQAGFEIITRNGLKSEIQIIENTVDLLAQLKSGNYQFIFTFPNFFKEFIKSLKLDQQQRESLLDILRVKDLSRLQELNLTDQKFIEKLVMICEPDIFLKNISALEIPALTKEILYIKDFLSSVSKYIDVGNVTIDLFDVAHFSYHRSFAFSVIADSTKGSLVKGGSYEVLENVPAVGASFYLENLL